MLGTETTKKIELSCRGAANYDRKRARLTCDDDTLGETETVVIGDMVYVHLEDGANSGLEAGWQKLADKDGDAIRYAAPEKVLATLRAGTREIERVGEDDVRGARAVRYRLIVEGEEVRAGPGEAVPVEVWIDGDGLVRKIVVENTGSTVVIEFFDFGAEVDIRPPPADQVQEIGAPIVPRDPTPCAMEPTPIGESQALKALRGNGFSVRREAGVCDVGVAAVVTNAEREDVLEREGVLNCFLFREPRDGAPTTVVRRGVDGGDAELLLANLQCSILADSPRAEEKIDPLEAAFEDLQRAIRP